MTIDIPFIWIVVSAALGFTIAIYQHFNKDY